MTDFNVQDHGSIVLLMPLNDSAEAWIAEHLPEDAQRFGLSVAIERRYFEAIYHGIINDGHTVS